MQVIQKAGEPNIYVSKAPIEYPTIRSLAWASYNWGSDIITISSWEPDYDVTRFYIGVHAYCGSDVVTNYTGQHTYCT